MRSCTGRDRQLQRLARAVGQRQLERLAVVLDALAAQRHAHDRDVLARALELAREAQAVPALGDLGARRSRCPSWKRPPEIWSSVAAVIAVIAGLRAGIWKIAEPSWMRSVSAASQASTVAASEP